MGGNGRTSHRFTAKVGMADLRIDDAPYYGQYILSLLSIPFRNGATAPQAHSS